MGKEGWRRVARGQWRLLWEVQLFEERSVLRSLGRGMGVWMRMCGQTSIDGEELMLDAGTGRRSWLW
jgi:hypothetical protein